MKRSVCVDLVRPVVVAWALIGLVTSAGCLAQYGGGSNTTTGGARGAATSLNLPPAIGSANGSVASSLLGDHDHEHEGLIEAEGFDLADSAYVSTLIQNAQAKPDPMDWVYCRGPEGNGVTREIGLPDTIDPRGDTLAWKKEGYGGRSTPIVMNGRIYMLLRAEAETAKEGERVVCLNAETGEVVWENRFNVWLSDVPDTRVGWSSVVGDPETGNVYALGVCGYFQCLDGATGDVKWSRPLHEQFGLLSTYGGRTNFPVVCDDLVIISAVIIGWGDMAKPAHRFLAFDKRTGEVVWFNGTRLLPYDTTYSTPTLTVLNGQKALVFGSGDGAVWAMQPRTGQPIWKYQFSKRGLNTAPLVVGDTVYTGHSEENIDTTAMGAMVAINGKGAGDISKSGQLWKTYELMVGKSAPILIDGRLYCFDDRAKLHILDPATGQPVVRKKALGTVMRAGPLYGDGKLYAVTANGRWYVLEPSEQGVKVLKRGRFPSGEECHASPICSHGRVYILTTGGLYCYYDESKKHGIGEQPAAPQEDAVDPDSAPAHAQVVPAEVLIQPGKSQKFEVRLYNAKGQFLKKSEATFSVVGAGKISADGLYEAPADAKHVAVTVTGKAGELSGTARIRIVPPLPWVFDFEGLDDLPVTWVGARYRHVLRDMGGSRVAVKITTIPKGTRSRAWFGPSDLHDYTIEADVRGAVQGDQMPDIGLIAQGYTLDLQGNGQALQIRTWGSHDLRTKKTVSVPWEANRWYRMKFRAENQDGKVLLQGKVWPKDQSEPDAWTIEVVDDVPNVKGSPGLYGAAKAAELYLDNLTVYPNK